LGVSNVSEPTIHLEEKASPELKNRIVQGLVKYNVGKTGDPTVRDMCLVLRDGSSEVVGGILAEASWGWLNVYILWVREDHRGRGNGSRLLERAEALGREWGCGNAHLDTFSFQAVPFYEKRGYEAFGRLENFPEGHARVFFRKPLE
jgi:GNAT superfamily N-acetyltransferase